MSENNSIRIHHGSREARGIIEIQAYINQLELTNFELKKKLKASETVVEQHHKNEEEIRQLMLHLEQANTEIAYYQAMTMTKNYGRPGKLSMQEIFEIRDMRKRGITLKVIAEQYHVSVALVHKVTKDIKKE